MKILRIMSCMLLIFSVPCLAASESVTLPTALQEIEGIPYYRNKFGDIFPEWQKVDPATLEEKLLKFVAVIKPTGAPIIITVPHAQGAVLNVLKKANFKFAYGNNIETRWMIQNKAHIPEPYTALAGGEVVVLNANGEMLVVEEHTRKNRMSFPGGHVDPYEHSRHAACRELQEEVGLTVKLEDLKLIALVNRLKANKEGATDYNHYYLAQIPQGTVQSDNQEIIKARWVPAAQLAQGKTIENLESNPIVQLLAQHIASGCKKSQNHVIPNYRRRETPSWPQADPNDVMHVELFQQSLISPAFNYKPLALAGVVLASALAYYRLSRAPLARATLR